MLAFVAVVAAKLTMSACRHKHDDGGVRAWKMLRLALRAEAAVAAVRDKCSRPALGTEPMPLLPIVQRLRLAEYPNLVPCQHGRSRARIAEVAMALERSRHRIRKGGEVHRDTGPVIVN